MKRSLLSVLAIILVAPLCVRGQALYTGEPYLQIFDTLASGVYWQPETALPPGWAVSHESYVWSPVTNGYSANYGTYSFSTSADDPDKSIGLVIGSTGAAYVGAGFRNDSGKVLTSFTLVYTVKQWAKGAVTDADQSIPFQYSLSANSLTSGTYSNTPALDMHSIHDGNGTFAALNGNAPENQVTVSNTVTGFVWLPGQVLRIRWKGVSHPFLLSHALALDNVQLTASSSPPAHPLEVWHLRHSVSGTSLNGVAYGNGLFVVVSAHGHIFTSPDGIAWTEQPTGINAQFGKVAWADGLFVAAGGGGAIFTSPDGTNWMPRTSGITARLTGITHGAGRFVVAAEGGYVLSSTNGIDWDSQVLQQWNSQWITFGAGHFVIGGLPGTNFVSPDGVNWFSRGSGTSANLYTMGSTGPDLIAIDTRNNVYRSSDASNWVHTGSVTTTRPVRVAYGHGYFVTGGGGPLEYSKDTITWKIGATGYLYVASDIAFGNGTFVAVGGGGLIKQSDPVIALEPAGGGNVQIHGPVGGTCRIEACTDLGSEAGWQLLETISLLQSPQMWTPPLAPEDQRFFRVVIDLPPNAAPNP